MKKDLRMFRLMPRRSFNAFFLLFSGVILQRLVMVSVLYRKCYALDITMLAMCLKSISGILNFEVLEFFRYYND